MQEEEPVDAGVNVGDMQENVQVSIGHLALNEEHKDNGYMNGGGMSYNNPPPQQQ